MRRLFKIRTELGRQEEMLAAWKAALKGQSVPPAPASSGRPNPLASLKLSAQKPPVWSAAKAKERTPAEFIKAMRKFASRTLQLDLTVAKEYDSYIALIRDGLSVETVTAIDVHWDTWETKNPGLKPNESLVQQWLELLLTEHTSPRHLRHEYKSKKQTDPSLTGLNLYITDVKKVCKSARAGRLLAHAFRSEVRFL